MLGVAPVLAAVAVLASGGSAWAADYQFENGSDLTPLMNLASGDTVTFAEGNYDLPNYIRISGLSNITITGNDNVVLNYNGAGGAGVPGIKQAVQIFNSNNITISDLTISAVDAANEGTWGTASTGIGVNSSCSVTLSGVTLSNFGKAAITATALQDSGDYDCATSGLTFDNVTIESGNLGIMFTNGSAAPAAGVADVIFTGTTNITGVAAGIISDSGDNIGAVTGVDGGAVALGVANITTKSGSNAIALNAETSVTVDGASVINGEIVNDMSDEEAKAAFGDNVAVVPPPADTDPDDSGDSTPPVAPITPAAPVVYANTSDLDAAVESAGLTALSATVSDNLQTVTVQTGLAVGTEVDVYFYSNAVKVTCNSGTCVVAADGTIIVDVPEGLTGTHEIAIYNEDNVLLGFTRVTLGAAPVVPPAPTVPLPPLAAPDSGVMGENANLKALPFLGTSILIGSGITYLIYRKIVRR
jgi:hypothetical protein